MILEYEFPPVQLRTTLPMRRALAVAGADALAVDSFVMYAHEIYCRAGVTPAERVRMIESRPYHFRTPL